MSLLRFNMLHAKRLRVLGRHVVALTLDISVTDGDLFVEMLRKFPNLESFSLWTESLSLAWPRLESLTVRIAPVEIDSLVVLHRFAKLRQLTLLNNYISDREDLAVLDTVLAIGTLEELRVEGKWDGAPGGLNPTCRVYRNGEVVAREERPLGRHGFLELYTLKGDCDDV
ncbi:hypothetical protein quinque_004051 [Culex quinquefasciatus]